MLSKAEKAELATILQRASYVLACCAAISIVLASILIFKQYD